eukprot:TRINITY_DN2092_c0_g1_i1.p1 TRINITY_DN2092_c0_g1~~TRINITY_DN2092_c0_g1_i1.p1  ORF type:complete len:816 (-),score=148.56 TRINITY_DN2092_c0_g1_i1:828-3275(-)
MEVSTTLQVDGMTCGSCAATITSVLESTTGVSNVEVSWENSSAKIISTLSSGELCTLISELGFPAKSYDFNNPPIPKNNDKQFEMLQRAKEAKGKQKEEDIEDVSPTDKEIGHLEIKGMTCSSCVNTIESFIQNTNPAVISISVALLAEKAELVYDKHKTSLQEIADSITDLGFTSTPIIKPASNTIQVSIEGMTCSSCVNLIENVIGSENGINSIRVNLVTKSGVVDFDPSQISARTITSTISDLGFTTTLDLAQSSQRRFEIHQEKYKKEIQALRQSFLVALFLTIPIFIIAKADMFLSASIVHFLSSPFFHALPLSLFLKLLLTTPVQFGIGGKFYVHAYKALAHRSANMDVLVAIATSAAYCYSLFCIVIGCFFVYEFDGQPDFFDTSAMLLAFISLGKYMEALAKGKTSEAIKTLMSLQPNTAQLLKLDTQIWESEGRIEVLQEETIQIELVEAGDFLKVTPGTTIPTDGFVVQGKSNVDESMITGESIPAEKKKGSEVIGGTVNNNGMLIIKATHVGESSGLAQIIRLIEDAQTSKAPIQSYADRISAIFVPGVVTISFITFVFWWIVCGLGYAPEMHILSGHDQNPFLVAMLFGISTVVIACPCALGLATPTAVMVGTGIGAANGVLIEGGKYLEIAQKIQVVLFDKTGTLTQGKLAVRKYQLVGDSKLGMVERENKFWDVIESLESASEHPLGSALVKYAQKRRQNYADENDQKKINSKHMVEDWDYISGKGISGKFKGELFGIGNRSFVDEFIERCEINNEKNLEKKRRKFSKKMGRTRMYSSICLFVTKRSRRNNSNSRYTKTRS